MIKIVQYFEALVNLEDGINSSVDENTRLHVGIHGNSEKTGKSTCEKMLEMEYGL